jgi:hypothetical protein
MISKSVDILLNITYNNKYQWQATKNKQRRKSSMANLFLEAAKFLEELRNERPSNIIEKTTAYTARVKRCEPRSNDLRILINGLSEVQKNPAELDDVVARFRYYGAYGD